MRNALAARVRDLLAPVPVELDHVSGPCEPARLPVDDIGMGSISMPRTLVG